MMCAHSDLDLYLITTDGSYAEFLAGREAWVRQLGESLFCPLELAAIRQAGVVILQFYREVATALAASHGLT